MIEKLKQDLKLLSQRETEDVGIYKFTYDLASSVEAEEIDGAVLSYPVRGRLTVFSHPRIEFRGTTTAISWETATEKGQPLGRQDSPAEGGFFVEAEKTLIAEIERVRDEKRRQETQAERLSEVERIIRENEERRAEEEL